MAKPGPIGANYTGCCIRTSENSTSTHSGEYADDASGGPLAAAKWQQEITLFGDAYAPVRLLC
jgi:hypothetical protein